MSQLLHNAMRTCTYCNILPSEGYLIATTSKELNDFPFGIDGSGLTFIIEDLTCILPTPSWSTQKEERYFKNREKNLSNHNLMYII